MRTVETARPRGPVRLAQMPEVVPPISRPTEAEPSGEPPLGPPADRDGTFSPDQVRLPLMGEGPFGATPQPDQVTRERYAEFVERTIDPESTLDLVIGRPRLLVFRQPPSRVQIADEEVATFTLVTATELSVAGVNVGTTVLNLWFPSAPNEHPEILSYLVRVIPDPEAKSRLERVYRALEQEINENFPDSVVRLSLVGDKVVVSGEARDIVEAAQILRIVAANAPGGARQERAEEIPVDQIQVHAGDLAGGELPEQGLESFLLRDINRQVINLLRVPGEQQIALRVTVAEVNRSAARSIGLDFSIANSAGDTVFASLTGGLIPSIESGGGVTSQIIGGNLPALIDNGQVTLAIEALRELNLARTLAEPNLVTMNGQPAQFRAGGQFPVPSNQVAAAGVGVVSQGVDFVPFGVQVRFVPYITDRDRIRLQVGASVSTRDESLATNVGGSESAGGTNVPGLQARTFQSTVELREGQTLAVAGLIQNNFGSTGRRVPFFGDLPVLGYLAGRNRTTADEQELVILITPELVHPLEACQTPQLPGADTFEPGDVEFYLANRLESRRSQDFRSQVRTDCDRLRRYHRCEDQFIIGAQGQSFGCCPSQTGNCGAGRIPAPEPVPAQRVSSDP